MTNDNLIIKFIAYGAENRAPEAGMDRGPKCGKCLPALLLVKSGQAIDQVVETNKAMEAQSARII